MRISIDAKATIKMGDFSRGGRSRVLVESLDHDFGDAGKAHLLGFYLPDYGETYLYLLPWSKHLSADAVADCLRELWNEELRDDFPEVQRLLLNLDNGPEVNSRRTQFMKRLVDFVDEAQIQLELAYYPPYHSKYNPIERVWGVLEQHWNGCLLDSLDTVLRMAKSMTFKGIHPVVNVVDRLYRTGVSLTQQAMKAVERRLDRLDALPKYFVNISPVLPA